MKKRVVITDYTFPNVDSEREAAISGGADFEAFQCKTSSEVVEAVRGADVVGVQFAPFDAEAIAVLNPNATIIRYGVGYDNIDVPAALKAGFKVGYIPDYCADEVADHTVSAILVLLRKLFPLNASVRQGEWAAVKVAKPLPPFSETKIGFFGLGQIGSAVLTRLRAFGFEFLVFDPAMDTARAKDLGVKTVSREDLLSESDLITLHAPAVEGTIGFFNAENLAKMKSTAMIVNSARGLLINENDLASALQSGALAGAALDVFHSEPLPERSPLREAPNVILTPHAAWYSEAAIGKLQSLMAEDIGRALAGHEPRKPVPAT